MSIRVDSGKGNWCEFRENKWTFGDRLNVLNSADDAAALAEVLGYVVAWNVVDIDGQPVPHDKGVGALMGVDDEVAVWLIRSWFEAREKRRSVPKAS